MPTSPTPNPLQILCFGDSLTEGYSMFGMKYTPYSETLQTRLDEQLGSEWKVEIETDGVSGELVTAGFRKRMEVLYGAKRVRESPFDWVIFLGGTNDIAYGVSTNKLYDEIKAITAIPLKTGAKVLMLTVPECGVRSANLDERRNDLNALIKGDERKDVACSVNNDVALSVVRTETMNFKSYTRSLRHDPIPLHARSRA